MLRAVRGRIERKLNELLEAGAEGFDIASHGGRAPCGIDDRLWHTLRGVVGKARQQLVLRAGRVADLQQVDAVAGVGVALAAAQRIGRRQDIAERVVDVLPDLRQAVIEPATDHARFFEPARTLGRRALAKIHVLLSGRVAHLGHLVTLS